MKRHRCAALGLALLFLLATACNLPKLADEQAQASRLPQTSFVFASDGTLVTQLHAEQNRVVVPFAQIPQTVRDAVIAIEDRRFYLHHGIDLRALVRAAYIDASQGRIVEGGSTITQQLVKNLYLGSEQTLGRKVDEAALAWQMENTYTKDQILAKYLNTVYFGEGAYGIEAAAQRYFSVHAVDLSRNQAALLAGLALAGAAFAGYEGRIVGTVVDENNAPIAGVTVTVTSPEFKYNKQYTSDANGKFTVTVIDASRKYAIKLEKEGCAPFEAAQDTTRTVSGRSTSTSFFSSLFMRAWPAGVM